MDDPFARERQRYYRLEIEPCVEDEYGVIPCADPEDAQFWGVYGRRRDDDLAEHIVDLPTLAAARGYPLVADSGLPVIEQFVGAGSCLS